MSANAQPKPRLGELFIGYFDSVQLVTKLSGEYTETLVVSDTSQFGVFTPAAISSRFDRLA